MIKRIVYCPEHGRVTNEDYNEEKHGGCSVCAVAHKELPKFKAKRPRES